MISIEARWRASMPVLAVVAGLSACANQSPPPAPTALNSPETETTSHTALPGGPITPNPFTPAKMGAGDREFYDRALAAIAEEQWAEAEILLFELTGENPALSQVWVSLGKVYVAQNRPEAAATALRNALRVNSNNLDAYNQLALLKREEGDFDAAEALYHRALGVWPFHAQTHLNLAILLDLYRGKGGEALRHYRAYQQRQHEMDRNVESWIVDLEQRLTDEAP